MKILSYDANHFGIGMDTALPVPRSATQIVSPAGSTAVGVLSPSLITVTLALSPLTARTEIDAVVVDADLFLVARAFSPDGTEIVYQGAIDPHTPIAHGWLRVSHRALDMDQSRPFLPVHRHDRAEPLAPATVYEVDVEILPTSVNLPAGYSLTLDVQGHDHVHQGAAAMQPNLQVLLTGSGPFVHKDPSDRPADVFGGTVTVNTGGGNKSYLLLPAIPAR